MKNRRLYKEKCGHKVVASKSNGQLFVQHVEGLSRDAVTKYQPILKDFIRGRHGIYALYLNNKLVYVGLASDLRTRLNDHLRDRHAETWDKFSVYLTMDANHMRELEALLIRIAKPEDNKQNGKFKKSENLLSRIQAEFKKYQKQEYECLFGKRKSIWQNKEVSINNKRDPAMKGFFKQREQIRFDYKGKTYFAVILPSGKIEFNGKQYNSPSMALQPLTGRAMNGWTCWKYQNSRNEWVLLDTLRRT